MREVKVAIVRWMDDHQPGFVECELIDRHGKSCLFVEKVPVVSAKEDVFSHTAYPVPGHIACELVSGIDRDETGREFVEIDTDMPWGIEATDGTTRFEVHLDQIVDFPS